MLPALLLAIAASSLAAEDRPSILFLLADDLRPDALGCTGNRYARTPNLDRLAASGALFTRALAPVPICTPSRAEVLTGRSGFRNGVLFFGEAIRPGLPTWPGTFRAAGWRTAYVGKWHNDGLPADHGFAESRRVFRGGMGPHAMKFVEDGKEVAGYSSRLFADAAIDFLDRRPEGPFFLQVSFTAPHDPREVPPGWEGRFDPAAAPLPGNFLPRHPFDNGEMDVRDEKLLPRPRTPEALRPEIAAYHAMVAHLDEQVGRVLEALGRSGQAERTLVIFAGDHGLALGSHGLLGKQNLYAHSVGTPLIIAGPRVPPGKSIEAPVYLRDLFPTACEIAGLEAPPGLDGRSLVPLLDGRAREVHPAVFAHYRDVQRMVQAGPWKLIRYPRIGREQLFDLETDPEERRDLIDLPEHRGRIDDLRERLVTWQRSMGDPLASPSGRPNVLLILADDLGAECLESYGGTSYRTPHLDALARSGVRFANAWATPLCSPSRVQLLTGRYGFRTGWTELIGARTPRFLDPKERTFGHLLGAAGYATALAGKWQLAHFDERPRHVKECGFEESCAWAWVYRGKQTSRYWRPAVWQDGRMREDVAERYGEDVFRDFLIDFMERNRERPFLAYYPMALVHAPFEPTPESPADRRDRRRDAPENFPDMVAHMDRTVGKLIEALERLGLREKTLVIFTGDNGTARRITSRAGGREIRGAKGMMRHRGVHVPFIASWPGRIPGGRVCEDPIDLSDVVPTLLELTGTQAPTGLVLDGRSFAPQLLGMPGTPREWVYSQLGEERMVRDRRWLIHSDGRLHDLAADPDEERDLSRSEDPEAKEALKRLRAALRN